MKLHSIKKPSCNHVRARVETGCANLNPPSPDTYVQRSWSGHDSISTVMCNFSSVESELVCEGSVWKGTVKNCSTPGIDYQLID